MRWIERFHVKWEVGCKICCFYLTNNWSLRHFEGKECALNLFSTFSVTLGGLFLSLIIGIRSWQRKVWSESFPDLWEQGKLRFKFHFEMEHQAFYSLDRVNSASSYPTSPKGCYTHTPLNLKIYMFLLIHEQTWDLTFPPVSYGLPHPPSSQGNHLCGIENYILCKYFTQRYYTLYGTSLH